MLFTLFIMPSLAAAAVARAPGGIIARPGQPVVRQLEADITSTSSVTSTSTYTDLPSTTPAPIDSLAAAAILDCTPSSICFDGFTCGQRYGA